MLGQGDIRALGREFKRGPAVTAEVPGRWQGQKVSNPRPTVLETVALPAELYPYAAQGLRQVRGEVKRPDVRLRWKADQDFLTNWLGITICWSLTRPSICAALSGTRRMPRTYDRMRKAACFPNRISACNCKCTPVNVWFGFLPRQCHFLRDHFLGEVKPSVRAPAADVSDSAPE